MKKALASVAFGLLLFLAVLRGGVSGQTPSTVTVRLVDPLSTGSSQSGDTFTATLAEPLMVNGHIVAQKDAYVAGQVREAISSGRLKRPASLTLGLKAVQAPSGRFPIQTGDLTVKAGSHATRNLLIIGGTAGAGAAIGGAAGGGKGAAIGAAAGAGAGTLGAYLTGKHEIVLPAETVMTFHVHSVTISAKELDRLQRASDGRRSADFPRSEDRSPVVVRRRHHGDDDEDDDDDEHEHERGRRYERPQHVDVVFLTGHRAGVEIYWPHRVERLTLRGDDLEEILEPLAEHTRVSVEFLRPRVKIKRED